MARAPMAAAAPMPDPTAGGGASGSAAMPGDGADPTDTGDDTGSDDVIVTITKGSDGSYTVYAGDEPDAGGGGDSGMSDDDADAMGDAGAAPAAGGADMGSGTGGDTQGQPADSIGAALKIAMDILQADKSSEGMAGSGDDQMAAGFASDKSPTPAKAMSSR